MAYFALLVYTLLSFYFQELDTAPDFEMWTRAPPTLLLPSEPMTIVLEQMDAWQANREQLLMALRLNEDNT